MGICSIEYSQLEWGIQTAFNSKRFGDKSASWQMSRAWQNVGVRLELTPKHTVPCELFGLHSSRQLVFAYAGTAVCASTCDTSAAAAEQGGEERRAGAIGFAVTNCPTLHMQVMNGLFASEGM